MFRVCSLCGKQFGEKEPFENQRVTHGLCPDCLALEEEKLKEFEKGLKGAEDDTDRDK